LLFTTDRLSTENLLREGVPEGKIKFVGNIMIDTLDAQRDKAATLAIEDIIHHNRFGGWTRDRAFKKSQSYSLLTLHRPSNVDDSVVLSNMVNFLTNELTKDLLLLWTIHPRTERQLKKFGLWERVISEENLVPLKPLSYHELLRLNMDARIVLTDSGGIQEECCVLGTPCLTLRWNTERPVTLQKHGGVSVLVGNDVNRIREAYREMLLWNRIPTRPELWDGNTAPRIVAELVETE